MTDGRFNRPLWGLCAFNLPRVPRACGPVAQFHNGTGQSSCVPRAACPPVLRTIAEEHWRASRQWHTAAADQMSIGQHALAPEATPSRQATARLPCQGRPCRG